MKNKSRKSVFLTSGIAALTLLLCAACKPPLDPIIEVAVENRVAFSTMVAPLTFVDPARLLTGGGGVQSAVFELTEARTGEVSVYNDPECAVPSSLVASLAGDRLTVVSIAGDIPEDTPFYAVITEEEGTSPSSAFAFTRQQRFEVPGTITWADVQAQIDAANNRLVDLFNRRWDVDVDLPNALFQDRMLANGSVRSITFSSMHAGLSRVSADEVEITEDANHFIVNYCNIRTLRNYAWVGYAPTKILNSTVGTLYYRGARPHLIDCTVGQIIPIE